MPAIVGPKQLIKEQTFESANQIHAEIKKF
jgi:hypothetical protein